MVTIEFEFPVEKDAHVFRTNVYNFFSNSFFDEPEHLLGITPVKKNTGEKDSWSFKLSFCKDKNDIYISEKYMKIQGGQLDLMNGARKVWAFA